MNIPKGFGNMGALLKQAQEAMKRAESLEKELRNEEVEVEKDGVRVRMNGAGEPLSISLDPSLVNPDELENLEDCILLALREAHAKSVELRQEKLKEITGGMPLPPGLGL
jgi:DNA-binding YbaB/EbfC family protein